MNRHHTPTTAATSQRQRRKQHHQHQQPPRTTLHWHHPRHIHRHRNHAPHIDHSHAPPQQKAAFRYVYDVHRITTTTNSPQHLTTNIFDSTNPLLTQHNVDNYMTLLPTHNGDKKPKKMVFLHALLASRGYFKPFLRSLQTSLKQHPNGPGTLLDIYIPDQLYHGDTPLFNDNTQHTTYDHDYLTQLSHHFEHFLLQEVCGVPKHRLEDVTMEESSALHQSFQHLGFVGHSLGARVLLLFHANLTQRRHALPPGILEAIHAIPLVSLDAAPATYNHNHNALIHGMIKLQDDHPEAMQTQTLAKHFLQEQCNIDPNTVAFALQNNFSQHLQKDLEKEYLNIVKHNLQNKNDENTNTVNNSITTASSESTLLYTSMMQHAYATRNNTMGQKQSEAHHWKSDLTAIEQRESDVFTWPLSDPLNQHASTRPDRVLFIGGLQSNRLTDPGYLAALAQQFPEPKIEMVRGGHFVQFGPDHAKVAQLTVSHLLSDVSSPPSKL